MTGFFLALSAILGLVIGSFLNVVVYRLPLNRSIVTPRSSCPACGHPIRWYDNIPIASWVILKGRCRDCKARISLRYPLVEALTMIFFVLSSWRFGLTGRVFVAWAFCAALIAISLIDLDHMIIPNRIVLPGAAIGLAASIALAPARWWVYLVSAVGSAAFMFILVLIWPGGMGMGDVKMALFMGAVLGPSVLVALFAAFLFGSVVGVSLIAMRKASRKSRLPFGPFLALGSLIGLFFGEAILHAYTSVYS
ncbi:MAG: prepilin peptidase [Thermoleophilia bacterium]|nr:prepilin peptidase [Thermoleophilia bacterium]